MLPNCMERRKAGAALSETMPRWVQDIDMPLTDVAHKCLGRAWQTHSNAQAPIRRLHGWYSSISFIDLVLSSIFLSFIDLNRRLAAHLGSTFSQRLTLLITERGFHGHGAGLDSGIAMFNGIKVQFKCAIKRGNCISVM